MKIEAFTVSAGLYGVLRLRGNGAFGAEVPGHDRSTPIFPIHAKDNFHAS